MKTHYWDGETYEVEFDPAGPHEDFTVIQLRKSLCGNLDSYPIKSWKKVNCKNCLRGRCLVCFVKFIKDEIEPDDNGLCALCNGADDI